MTISGRVTFKCWPCCHQLWDLRNRFHLSKPLQTQKMELIIHDRAVRLKWNTSECLEHSKFLETVGKLIILDENLSLLSKCLEETASHLETLPFPLLTLQDASEINSCLRLLLTVGYQEHRIRKDLLSIREV